MKPTIHELEKLLKKEFPGITLKQSKYLDMDSLEHTSATHLVIFKISTHDKNEIYPDGWHYSFEANTLNRMSGRAWGVRTEEEYIGQIRKWELDKIELGKDEQLALF